MKKSKRPALRRYPWAGACASGPPLGAKVMFMSRARTVVFAGLTVATVALAVFAVAANTSIAIYSVSNRADLISGGDVLLRVTLPEGQSASAATLAVGGAAIPGALKPAPDGNGQ